MGDKWRPGNQFRPGGRGLEGALTTAPDHVHHVALGWRAAFCDCGAAGIFVAIASYSLATDRPDQHSRVNQSEPEVVGSNPPAVA